MLTHKDTGRIYIGQSSDLKNRFKQYRHSSRLKRKLTYIERAIQKHGWEAFDAKLIIQTSGKEYLDLLEINAIRVFDCMKPNGFNLREGGNTSEFTQETRKKMSAIRKEYLKNPEVIKNLQEKRKKQVISEEAYAKAAAKQKQMKWMNNGFKSYKVSPDKIENMKKQGFVFGRLINYITEEYKNTQSKNAFKQWEKVKSCHI